MTSGGVESTGRIAPLNKAVTTVPGRLSAGSLCGNVRLQLPARSRSPRPNRLVAGFLASSIFAASSVGLAASEYAQATAMPVVAAAPIKPAPATATPATAPQQPSLQSLVDEFAAPRHGRFAVVVKDLRSGETASINPDRAMTSASLYKLFVAAPIYQQADEHNINLGVPAGGETGRGAGSCAEIMITISDNACGRALASTLGWGRQNDELSRAGYPQKGLSDPHTTSAADTARVLERLYLGTLSSSSTGNQFPAPAKRVRDGLPKGVPAGTLIAHKTGDLDGYVHDAGIVYGPKTDYLVVVMSGPHAWPQAAKPAFAQLNDKLWARLQQ